MSGSMRLAAALALLLTACTPTASGPMPPRPFPPTSGVTVTTGTTTTTVAVTTEAIPARPACPTDFCVVYHLDPDARWSDGAPVTAADLAHTALLNDDPEAGPRASPYSAVTSVDVLDDHTARVVFEGPYGGWQRLFERVIRSGQDAPSISDLETTGPFAFAEWAEGEQVTLQRDPRWWAGEDPISGGSLGNVAKITFVFMDDLDDMLDALEDGEVQVISARPDVSSVERLAGMDGIEHVVAPGPFWEHIDFHHDDPTLSQDWVREVFSLSIDREKILDRTVRLIDPAARALDNTIWMSGTARYEPHFNDGYQPERARQLMADHDCSPGEDGVQVCDGTRMSFVWASTNDEPAREEIFVSVSEDLKAVGIEILPEFVSPSVFVTREFLFGGPDTWQLIDFSWRARPDPIAANPTYYCDDAGDLNVNRYCSEDVDRLIRATETTVSPARRAALYNRADRLYLEDRALIPLYQKPTLLAWDTGIRGPAPNYTLSGDLWNVATWATESDEVVVALPSEPVDLDPLTTTDESANVILGPLLYGAFGMSPSQEHIPVLVESVELITAEGR